MKVHEQWQRAEASKQVKESITSRYLLPKTTVTFRLVNTSMPLTNAELPVTSS